MAAAACEPAHVVFYAQTDWLRLATKLAQQPSPCADYSISVPPLAADKTQARSGQASQIRALGSNFHALDEISWTGWSAWVAAGNGSWYDAGVTARQRMAAAGFDTGAGDTWAVNELSSAVRTGTGSARQNALEFLRGLASDGVKGVVFMQGIGQATTDTTTYKLALQSWLEDETFWTTASGFVRDWAQENYGDLRTYAVAGTSPDSRRDQEVQYLGHELELAHAGPATAAAARAFLDSTYVAFGNAAWAWPSAYGWTQAPLANMQDFVSGQVYAARSLGAPSGVDRFGFAWSPSNTLGASDADFATQTGALLDRLAAAIRDTGTDAGERMCARLVHDDAGRSGLHHGVAVVLDLVEHDHRLREPSVVVHRRFVRAGDGATPGGWRDPDRHVAADRDLHVVVAVRELLTVPIGDPPRRRIVCDRHVFGYAAGVARHLGDARWTVAHHPGRDCFGAPAARFRRFTAANHAAAAAARFAAAAASDRPRRCPKAEPSDGKRVRSARRGPRRRPCRGATTRSRSS